MTLNMFRLSASCIQTTLIHEENVLAIGIGFVQK